uniref:Uncharacterized protein n=1 Tax=Panagrolaimus sp. ES5 TaxID=591445 RepID=A0AC34G6F2_9BILA
MVRKPDFKIENLIVRVKENQYLFVRDLTTTSDKYLWFKYSFDKKEKRYRCRNEKCKNGRVGARLRHDGENGVEYIELSKAEHICEPKEYDSKIINLPNFEVDENRLYIFDKDDKTFCYVYNYRPGRKSFVCPKCHLKNHSVSAKLIQNRNDEDCIELGQNKHICEKQKYKK